ncbi:LuxR C-terminal-related transcriptional regulator [Janibacter melonis]|uniref:LuxR C-terminal-related transcriptional regulator n=1 Tax=Janibacter melonis TaxID=262209 RepID=UPI0020954252|nr:LuxR C-terminal-related transcriptional regulator [Janibacter melonis]
MLAAGASDANVARQLGVSVRTVERRVRLVMERLGAQSRLQAGVEPCGAAWSERRRCWRLDSMAAQVAAARHT